MQPKYFILGLAIKTHRSDHVSEKINVFGAEQFSTEMVNNWSGKCSNFEGYFKVLYLFTVGHWAVV